MGTLAEIVYRQEMPPAILFEDIPGYPKGFRAISGTTNSAKRLAIVLGFAPPSHPLDVVRAYRDRMKTHKPIPPRVVTDGPVLQNIVKTG
ncbi:MAG: UbiD family decarboxylase, partial [Betaproteobacteria bacterium]